MLPVSKKDHKNGIHLIMDFVLNHTSDQHPWFQDAISDPESIYRDYYIFAVTGIKKRRLPWQWSFCYLVDSRLINLGSRSNSP